MYDSRLRHVMGGLVSSSSSSSSGINSCDLLVQGERVVELAEEGSQVGGGVGGVEAAEAGGVGGAEGAVEVGVGDGRLGDAMLEDVVEFAVEAGEDDGREVAMGGGVAGRTRRMSRQRGEQPGVEGGKGPEEDVEGISSERSRGFGRSRVVGATKKKVGNVDAHRKGVEEELGTRFALNGCFGGTESLGEAIDGGLGGSRASEA